MNRQQMIVTIFLISNILNVSSSTAMEQVRVISAQKIKEVASMQTGFETLHLSPNWNRCRTYKTFCGNYRNVTDLLRHQAWSSYDYGRMRIDDDKHCDWNDIYPNGEAQLKDVLFDGPNENGLCVIADNVKSYNQPNKIDSRHYLQQLTGQTVSTPSAPGWRRFLFNMKPLAGRDRNLRCGFTHTHSQEENQEITAVAMGPQNQYALASTYHRDSLQVSPSTIRVYNFKNRYLKFLHTTELVKEIPVLARLRKLAFIHSTLIALSVEGSVYNINIVNGRVGIDPMTGIKDFAVDPKNPEHIVWLKNDNTLVHQNIRDLIPPVYTPIIIPNLQNQAIQNVWLYRNRLGIKLADDSIQIHELESTHPRLPQPKKVTVASLLRKSYKIAMRNKTLTFGIPALAVGYWWLFNKFANLQVDVQK